VIDAAQLLADAKAQVNALVEDLQATVDQGGENAAVVDREYEAAKAAGRTGLTKAAWAEGLHAQAAVAWVLGCVFVRFCEDNDLVPEPLFAGPGPRRQIALDHRSAYLQANPAHDDRHWLREVFGRYAQMAATGEVFGPHNPLWLLSPSADGARQLLQAFQAVDPDTGEIRHDFTDPSWDTRFLGDLYQDLSDHAKKTYALLQTPEFVEAFILDRTLEPALETFGLRDTTAIDPTCGSGHFLLGVFHRLFQRWVDAEPGTNRRELAQRSLDAIGGVDLNPFAAAIARFRLMLAAMRAAGDKRLADAPGYRIHVAVGDSLLHGDAPGALPGMAAADVEAAARHGYATEDRKAAHDLLSRPWQVVVGNPPYVIVKDPALNSIYRARFTTCRGKYSLGVPFTELFWHLARHEGDAERAGYVGMITANSFMKRQMGKRLVEEWVPQHDLTHVIDTSGAYIPGHGTPTVILLGRGRRPVASTVRAVMGIRGEPSTPSEPGKGLVWTRILEQVDWPGSSSDFVSVVDLDRQRLTNHPWSIGGGGAADLKEVLDASCKARLGVLAESIGFASFPGTDDAFVAPARSALHRMGYPQDLVKVFVTGEAVRDWSVAAREWAFAPYDGTFQPIELELRWAKALWPFRSNILGTVSFGKRTRRSLGDRWWTWYRWVTEKYQTPLSITFAHVATHNHFVLDRGGKVFKQSAPVIKLPEGTSEQRHLELLGLLNSSTACFWMKQVFHNKGSTVDQRGARQTTVPFEDFWDHDCTKLQAFPVAAGADGATASLLDSLAQELAACAPAALAEREVPSADALRNAQERYHSLRARMIAAQERLDWEVYRLYGLVEEDLTTGEEPEPPLRLGERAFEIVLARRMAAGREESSWFQRHGSTPITELPAHWPESYKRLVERRIERIETDRNIGLIERPEHKRRWAAKPWDDQVKKALRSWLLDRLEDPRYWPEPAAITTTARLAAEARTDADFMQVARLYAGREDVDVAVLVDDLVRAEAVPYLAALRFTPSGLRKHAQWLETWELQRREDAGEDVGEIPVPPKYTKADFAVGWEHRGKLDVPKERFISYPGAERETDASLPVGWAGWDHLARARALATWYLQAKRDGRDQEHLIPLLAGLLELVPWLRQWYDEPNPDPALDRPGSQIAALVDAELRSLHLTAEQVTAWQPPPPRRGRRRA